MIEEILPAAAATAEARDDAAATTLFPEEERVVARAVEKRRREFATGRTCAHRALEGLGLEPRPVPAGERGEPLWPTGVVGAITHCQGYRGCAVAHAAELLTIGIDAEPHEPLPEGVLGAIALPEEARMLQELSRSNPSIHWERLLFSAKETVYKAWYPLAKRSLGFEDATLTIDPDASSFSARLLVPGPTVAGEELRGFRGRWLAREGLVIAAIAVKP